MKSFKKFIIEEKKPKILERLINQLKDKGFGVGAATAIATKQQQKAGNLKKGSHELTKKGKKRQSMGAAGRAKDRAAKSSGHKASEYNYNPRTNRATLDEELIFESLFTEATRHVFSDFDETLASDSASVKIGDKKLSAMEFSSYIPKKEDPKPDFSEFRTVNNPVVKHKHFALKAFKKAASKLASKKKKGETDLPVIGVVTARPRSSEPHIRNWLRNNGIENADDVHIHAVQSSDPMDKVRAIQSHIHAGRIKPGDHLHFFDDHLPNVKAISSMQQDHPKIRIKSIHVQKNQKKENHEPSIKRSTKVTK